MRFSKPPSGSEVSVGRHNASVWNVVTWPLAFVVDVGTPQMGSQTVENVSFAPFVTDIGNVWNVESQAVVTVRFVGSVRAITLP